MMPRLASIKLEDHGLFTLPSSRSSSSPPERACMLVCHIIRSRSARTTGVGSSAVPIAWLPWASGSAPSQTLRLSQARCVRRTRLDWTRLPPLSCCTSLSACFMPFYLLVLTISLPHCDLIAHALLAAVFSGRVLRFAAYRHQHCRGRCTSGEQGQRAVDPGAGLGWPQVSRETQTPRPSQGLLYAYVYARHARCSAFADSLLLYL